MHNLDTFIASNNKIGGILLDHIFTRYRRLKHFEVEYNQLTGTVPDTFKASVETLRLGANKFTGTIPDLSHMIGLTSLHLFQNRLTGGIPSSIGLLTKLRELWLYNNKIEHNIPQQVGDMERLETAYLDNNKLAVSL